MRQTLTNYYGGNVVEVNEIVNPANTNQIVQLHVSATKLAKMDILTDSDPICVLYIKDMNNWREIGRTEVINNDLNPTWVKYFTLAYHFEIRQTLKFSVYDIDSNTSDLSAQDFIGEVIIDLCDILYSQPKHTSELFHPKKKKRGCLHIVVETVRNNGTIVNGSLRALKLKRMSLFGNKPYFIISKLIESNIYVPVYQSEVSKNNNWRTFDIPYQALCNLNPNNPVKISFYNYKNFTSSQLIGEMELSYAKICESLGSNINLLNRGKNVGCFRFSTLNLINKYTFLDYIRGGLQINLITAIDFTLSNGNPRAPESLHHFGTDSLNQYEACIRSIGNVVCPYDTDQLFPVFGFGFRHHRGPTPYCCNLTLTPEGTVNGLEGIISIYRSTLEQIDLAGPTLFQPVIRTAKIMAERSFSMSPTYTILLIITDGVINDFQDTIDEIVSCGRSPLSIIIVGVGNEDFTAMKILDADNEPLVNRGGIRMCRDLVQFVPFLDLRNLHQVNIAEQVLEELPRQVCEWADINLIRPF